LHYFSILNELTTIFLIALLTDLLFSLEIVFKFLVDFDFLTIFYFILLVLNGFDDIFGQQTLLPIFDRILLLICQSILDLFVPEFIIAFISNNALVDLLFLNLVVLLDVIEFLFDLLFGQIDFVLLVGKLVLSVLERQLNRPLLPIHLVCLINGFHR